MKKLNTYKHIKVKKFRIGRNLFTKFILKWRGKRDGKKGIPSSVSNNHFMTPNIAKEHNKVYLYTARNMKMISLYNAYYFREVQALISILDVKLKEYNKTSQLLTNKPSDIDLYIPDSKRDQDFENYLKSKHVLEQNLDSLAVRTRRFEEYQNKLSKYRTRLDSLTVEINDTYKMIMVCTEVIKRTLELAEPMFLEACSTIGIRMSWYWEGVMLKHSQSDNLPPTPLAPDFTQFRQMTQSKLDEITEIRTDIQGKMQVF